jgi:hypothetical protein
LVQADQSSGVTSRPTNHNFAFGYIHPNGQWRWVNEARGKTVGGRDESKHQLPSTDGETNHPHSRLVRCPLLVDAGPYLLGGGGIGVALIIFIAAKMLGK